MIQRIQTVYLLLVTGILITSMFLTLGTFIIVDGTLFSFSPLGIDMQEAGFNSSSWGLFAILILATIISIATIFLFKNRILQIRMTVFNTILLVGYYLSLVAFVFILKDKIDAQFQMAWGVCLPIVSIILNYLAIRAIGKDEVMVKAADRLR